jgi:hypothetical protein
MFPQPPSSLEVATLFRIIHYRADQPPYRIGTADEHCPHIYCFGVRVADGVNDSQAILVNCYPPRWRTVTLVE